MSSNSLLAADPYGFRVEGVYSPGVGSVNAQGGTPITDPSSGLQYAPQVVQIGTISPSSNPGFPSGLSAIVQKAKAVSTGSVASLAASFANPVTVGNSIVVVAGCGNGTAMTVADTLLNTYTQAVNAPNSTTFEAAIFFAVGIAGGSDTVTVTNAGTAASMAVEIYEVSGLIAQVTAQPDTFVTGTGTSATASAAAIAPSTPNALVFMGVAVGTAAQAVSVTSGTTWTLDSTQNSAGTPAGLFTFGALSQALSTLTPVVPKATLAGSEPFAVAAAIFKPVVMGVQGTFVQGGWNYTNITTQTTTNIKLGPGVLHAVIINKPLASGVVEIDDATSHTTPAIATITLPGTLLQDGPKEAIYDAQFNTGLSVTTSGATQDVTVIWR